MTATKTACVALLLIAGFVAGGAVDAASSDAPAGYRVLERRCFQCHGAPQRSGLDLRAAVSALQGGEHGRAIIQGDAAGSRLYRKIAGQDRPTMPPSGPLPASEVQAVREWIDAGAPYPKNGSASATWWSFRPVSRPPVPETSDPRVSTPIDAFIIDRLRREGMAPNPRAGPATLLRRVHLGLTGLPPSPAELAAFEKDPSPQAYERVVDRLLASPRYGERWASPWLDLARYAEDSDYKKETYPNAWRYRDYVIRSLNADKPYDQFAREQVAGDELDPRNPDARTATGFLVLGPSAHRPAAITKRYHEKRDEALSTTGYAFLGLTIECARCHDHKSDPITQAEYFRLQAYFAGLDAKPDVPLVSADATGEYQRRMVEWERKTAHLRSQLDRLEAPYRDAVLRETPLPEPHFAPLHKSPEHRTPRDRLYAAAIERLVDRGAVDRLILRKGGALFADAPYFAVAFGLLAALIAASLSTLAARRARSSSASWAILACGVILTAALCYGISRMVSRSPVGLYRAAASAGENSRSPLVRALAGISQAVFRNPDALSGGAGRVLFDGPAAAAYRAVGGAAFASAPVLALGGLALLGLAGAGIVRTRKSIDASRRVPAASAFLLCLVAGCVAAAVSLRSQQELAGWRSLNLALQGYDAQRPQAPAHAFGAVELGTTPPETRRLAGGDISRPAEVVNPGVPAALGTADAGQPLPDLNSSGRRAALARWIASAANPLFARVIVNRVWQEHFGQGLARTTGDFGLGGEQPSHPELLDWLASTFAAPATNDASRPGLAWSLKGLHRLIVLSSAYTQSAAYRPDAAAKDPDDRLLWRFRPRRLEAETLRDSLLAISGELDLTEGGPSVDPEPKADAETAIWRRTVYVTTKRASPYEMAALFDVPDRRTSCPRRTETNNAGQALLMLNSDLVAARAEKLAHRLAAEAPDDAARVDLAYRLVFSRSPSADEVSAARTFLRRIRELSGSPREGTVDRGLFALCRSLFNANEFLHVE